MGIDKMNKVSFVILLFVLSFSVTGEIYRVYVDREFGFWAVRSHDINHTVNYNGRTLNIQTGDTVEWENNDYTGNRITIISDNLLWEGGRSLGGSGSIFRFTFNSSNAYRFHIEERSRFEANTTEENVSTYDEDEDIWTNTTVIKPYEITYFNPQYQTIIVTGPQVGSGTSPIKRSIPIPTDTTSVPISDGIDETILSYSEIIIKSATSIPTTKPTVTITPIPTPVPTPAPMESYQEFTLYEIMKNWYTIINTG
jgi:hypothetical protein